MAHGFKLINTYEVSEQNAVLREYEHTTGAKLIHMDTADNNNLFSVAFRTIPFDDTGVFHILEHSVLCGSDKYPVKEPFVELLKSSMNTFLNALTFPDKTMYPVSSRNEKDFYNLMSVYLDAVFHPAIYDNPNIFYQEGWNYDYPEKGGEISYKGVVLNEMKGAVSSLDTIIYNKMMKLLYPDVCYGYVSGGSPSAIPELTYERFIDTHRKFYSPANAIFYIEGNQDAEKSMSVISQVLETVEFSGEPAVIESQNPVAPEEITGRYPINEGQTEEGRTKVAFGRIHADCSMKERIYSTMMLCAFLTDSNEAPLSRIILERELAEDVRINLNDGINQPYLQLVLENTDPDKVDAIREAVRELRKHYMENGISASELEPTLNNIEFAFRDGMEPKGLIHNMMVLNSYMYGHDPTMYLRYDDTFRYMRDQISTDYYRNLLVEMLDIDSYSCVIMIPDAGMEALDESKEAERIEKERAAWTDEEEQAIFDRSQKLLEWQMTPDSEENIARVPKLSLEDVSDRPQQRITRESKYGDAVILEHPSELTGITYINMYFPVPAEYADRIAGLAIISLLIGKLPAAGQGLFEMMQDIKANVGSLEFSVDTFAREDGSDTANVYFIVNMSCLNDKIDEARRILRQLLLETDFSSTELISHVLNQDLNDFRDEIIQNGSRMAIKRICANLTSVGYAKEQTEGISNYEFLKELTEKFDSRIDEIRELADILVKEVFTQSGLVCSVTARENGLAAAKKMVDVIPATTAKTTDMSFPHTPARRHMVKIPAAITYAVAGNNLNTVGGSDGVKYGGAWKVASKIISLEYLWQEVRVKRGAYGCGMAVASTGNVVFHSYRDPNGENTYEIYAGAGQFLREFAQEHSLESYIISAIADTEPVLTPKNEGTLADVDYLRGVDYEYLCRLRSEMINTTKQDLMNIADVLDEMWKNESYCLVASGADSFKADDEAVI